nr:TldD/PmbA family protein [Candidatus Njordarchaeum guaymaensis]
MSLTDDWEDLINHVRKAIGKFEKKATTNIEAFLTATNSTEVTISNSEIMSQNIIHDAGVGFRVVVAGDRVGFACTSKLTQDAILEAGQKALAIANASSRMPNLSLPEENKIRKLNGLFDSRVEGTSIEDAVELANRAISAAEGFDNRVIAKSGRVSYMMGWRGVINSLGVDCEERETRTVLYLGGSGKQKGETTGFCADYEFKRTADLNPEKVGRNVGEMVVAMFNPKPVETFQGTVIFGAEPISSQVCDVLVDTLKGERVISGGSAWGRKIDEAVVSDSLTIRDNSTYQGGFSTRSFDDEGFPSQDTLVIEKGVLRSFLHNATTASALQTRDTGNASRFPGGYNVDILRSIAGNGYRAKPEVYPSNLIIKPGNHSKNALISETDKGVLVESMSGFA